MRHYEIDIATIDLEGFKEEIEALGKEAKSKVGKKELKHGLRVDFALRLMYYFGLATSWLFINPISIILIALSKSGRWAMLGHHIGHGAYDKIEGAPHRFNSDVFGRGRRRIIDWFDWMLPAAWRFEHNVLHHYHVGEVSDPDFPQKNVETLRNRKLPMWVKYLNAFGIMATWKFMYYAPNTLYYLLKKQESNAAVKEAMHHEIELAASFPGSRIYSPISEYGRQYWGRCILPYALVNFVVLPALFLPLGFRASLFVLINLVLAEILTNVHTFATIVTNHAGDDVPYFLTPVRSKGEFYFRQVVGSVNYESGNEVVDFLHCYVNYQIEHHLWPDLPMNTYREIQPKVQSICEKYGIPYIKENVFYRTKKLLDVMVGKAHMQPMATESLVGA